MSILFKAAPLNDARKKDEKQLYYAVPKRKELVTIDDLSTLISQKCTATTGDVKLVLEEFANTLISELKNGNSVKLDKVGTFSLSLTSTKVSNPDKLRTTDVKVSRLLLRTAPSFMTKMKDAAFERKE